MQTLLIQYSTEASRSTEPFAWQAAGMGYLFRSSEGRFLAIDGGFARDADAFTELARGRAEGTPEIPLWILTHPHGDHYGVLTELARREETRRGVRVRKILACLPPETFTDAGRGTAYGEQIRLIHGAAKALGATEIRAESGGVFRVDDLTVEILLTYDDLARVSDPNESSLIFRVSCAGQTVLFCGDTYELPARLLAEKAGKALRCDFCQLAHHGLNGGAEELYALAEPKIALVPMARPAYEEMTRGAWAKAPETAANRKLLLTLPPERQWLSADGDRIVTLPYEF